MACDPDDQRDDQSQDDLVIPLEEEITYVGSFSMAPELLALKDAIETCFQRLVWEKGRRIMYYQRVRAITRNVFHDVPRRLQTEPAERLGKLFSKSVDRLLRQRLAALPQ